MKHSLRRICLAGIVVMFAFLAKAHDFEAGGIYYNFKSADGSTVEVTYRGSSSSEYAGEYSGNITIPASVEYEGLTYAVTGIGNDAMKDCTGLKNLTISEGVTTIGNASFYGCDGLKSLTIPSSVTSIGDYAFCGCIELTSLTIPDGMTSIGYYAFAGCDGLTSLTIPSSVTSIGDYAFLNCCLAVIMINDGTENLEFGSSVFYNNEVQMLYLGRDFTCNISGVRFQPFSQKTSLASVVMSNNVTSICDYAFYQCEGLENVAFSDALTSIGTSAFEGCYNLTSVTIPEGVTSIGDYAFYNCNGLTSLTSYATTPPTCGADTFTGIDKDICTLHVPAGTTAEYQVGEQWADFHYVTDDVTSINSAYTTAAVTEVGRYNIHGQRIEGAQPGVNIIRYSDGTTRKVQVN